MENVIVEAVVEAIRRAVVYLPPDVKEALRKAYELEDNPVAKVQLEAILKNVELAEKLGLPLCQDTGLITFYVKAGAGFPGLRHIEELW